MDDRQLRDECLENPLIDPCYDDMVGTIHTCPECGMSLSVVECCPSCPHYEDCEDRELHVSAGTAWCPVYQIIETDGLLERLKVKTHVEQASDAQALFDDFAAPSQTHVREV